MTVAATIHPGATISPDVSPDDGCYIQSNANITSLDDLGWVKINDRTFTVYRTTEQDAGIDRWTVIESLLDDDGKPEFRQGGAGLGPSGAIDYFLGTICGYETIDEFRAIRSALYQLESERGW